MIFSSGNIWSGVSVTMSSSPLPSSAYMVSGAFPVTVTAMPWRNSAPPTPTSQVVMPGEEHAARDREARKHVKEVQSAVERRKANAKWGGQP